jgi:hypothetical protein
MTETKPSIRSARRELARGRREYAALLGRECFELMVAGHSMAEIAASREVGVAKVRRVIDRMIADRPSESPERLIALQTARLGKALRVIDRALEGGELKAVAPLMRVIGQLDRYHGLSARLAAPAAAPALPPPRPQPLALTHDAEIAPQNDT